MTDKPEMLNLHVALEPEVARVSLLSMQVCIPKDYTDEQAEDFANQAHPTGIKSRWKILKDGPDPERVDCESRCGCCHVVMTC